MSPGCPCGGQVVALEDVDKLLGSVPHLLVVVTPERAETTESESDSIGSNLIRKHMPIFSQRFFVTFPGLGATKHLPLLAFFGYLSTS